MSSIRNDGTRPFSFFSSAHAPNPSAHVFCACVKPPLRMPSAHVFYSCITLPTTLPTALPTTLPTALPTTLPTALPTTLPTALPTTLPTALPTTLPTQLHQASPTQLHQASPTQLHQASPTQLYPSITQRSLQHNFTKHYPSITQALPSTCAKSFHACLLRMRNITHSLTHSLALIKKRDTFLRCVWDSIDFPSNLPRCLHSVALIKKRDTHLRCVSLIRNPTHPLPQ